jgi:DNA invertase Pin-like site-specific DNA recombinase
MDIIAEAILPLCGCLDVSLALSLIVRKQYRARLKNNREKKKKKKKKKKTKKKEEKKKEEERTAIGLRAQQMEPELLPQERKKERKKEGGKGRLE